MSQHGIYKVNLPLYDESQATMSEVCLDKTTMTFPLYPIQADVFNDIIKTYKDQVDLQELFQKYQSK